MSQIFMAPGTYDENLAHVETGDVASRNYAAGEFLTWKGVLHSAKTAISTGETFVEDTNVQDESDGGLANALISKMFCVPDLANKIDITSDATSSAGYEAQSNGYVLYDITGSVDAAVGFALDINGQMAFFTRFQYGNLSNTRRAYLYDYVPILKGQIAKVHESINIQYLKVYFVPIKY